VDQVDHGDHNPPWWSRSVQDHRGPRSNIFLMMRNLGRCLLGVLTVPLRQPDSTPVQHFKHTLTCSWSLLDFAMMAQYWRHTNENMQYMEDYANQFHERKDIFLEFRLLKQTQAKADTLRNELRHQRILENQLVTRSKWPQLRKQDRQEVIDQYINLIHPESHFNFIKMHLISHFRNHIRQFSNIPIYSTVYEKLLHKDQIKDGYQCSHKIAAVRQILSSYGRQHTIQMRLLNLEFLRHAGADLRGAVVEYLEKASTAPAQPAYHRVVKARHDNVPDVIDLSKVLDVSPEPIC